MDRLADNPIRLATNAPLSSLMPRVSSSMRVGVYDCPYVARAEREGCEFITAGDKLIKNIHSKFPFVISFASMP
jgi:predicted nucleic acid-binding protein